MYWYKNFQLIYAICKKLDSQDDISNLLRGIGSYKYLLSDNVLKKHYNSLIFKVKVDDTIVRVEQFKFQNLKKKSKIAVIGGVTNGIRKQIFKRFFSETPIIFKNLDYWDFHTKLPIVWENPVRCIADFNKLRNVLERNTELCVIENPSVWFLAMHYDYLKYFDYIFVFNLGDPPIDKLQPDRNRILSPLSRLVDSRYSNFLLRSIVLKDDMCAVISKKDGKLSFLDEMNF